MSLRASAADVSDRLAATDLAGALLTEVPLPGDIESTWILDLPDGDLETLWAQARDAVVSLGYHPVAVTANRGEHWRRADLFSRGFYGSDGAPESVITRSRTLSVDDALRRFDRHDDFAERNWDDVVDLELGLTRHFYGSSPDVSALADVARGDRLTLERRLLAWEEALHPTTDAHDVSHYFSWRRDDNRVGLALLPLIKPCDATAYLSFFGAAMDGGHEALTRLMCSWEERFGAQLVANWWSALQFVASHPPATLGLAFELAVEHDRAAPDTTMDPGLSLRHLARHLWCSRRWRLSRRP